MKFFDYLAPITEHRHISRREKIIRVLVFTPILLVVGWPMIIGGAAMIVMVCFPPIMLGVAMAFLPKLSEAIGNPVEHGFALVVTVAAIVALIASNRGLKQIRRDYLPFAGRAPTPVRDIAAQQIQLHY